jgi:hypothetical protein
VGRWWGCSGEKEGLRTGLRGKEARDAIVKMCYRARSQGKWMILSLSRAVYEVFGV